MESLHVILYCVWYCMEFYCSCFLMYKKNSFQRPAVAAVRNYNTTL